MSFSTSIGLLLVPAQPQTLENAFCQIHPLLTSVEKSTFRDVFFNIYFCRRPPSLHPIAIKAFPGRLQRFPRLFIRLHRQRPLPARGGQSVSKHPLFPFIQAGRCCPLVPVRSYRRKRLKIKVFHTLIQFANCGFPFLRWRRDNRKFPRHSRSQPIPITLMLQKRIAGVWLCCRSGSPSPVFASGSFAAIVLMTKIFQCFFAGFSLAPAAANS